MIDKKGFFFTGDELLVVAEVLRHQSIAVEDDEDAQGYDLEQAKILNTFAQKLHDLWDGDPKQIYEVVEHR